MRTLMHTDLLDTVTCLPTDYTPWGAVVRWADDSVHYPDCSSGCKHASALQGELGNDWVVCTNINSPRFGKLTFEHQAGVGCYEEKLKGISIPEKRAGNSALHERMNLENLITNKCQDILKNLPQ